jgi:DNA-binding MarR family transcriptional regulator
VRRHTARPPRRQEGARLHQGVSTFRGPLLPRWRSGRLPRSLDKWSGFGLLVVANAIEERYAKAAADAGISLRDFVLLVEIERAPGGSQSGLARRVGLTRARVSEQLAVLDTAGYVEREMNQMDLRRRRLWVSAEGQRAVEDVAERIARAEKAWLAQLEYAERIAFQAAVKRLHPRLAAERRALT